VTRPFLFLPALGLLLAGGCTATRVLTREELVGTRSAKYTLQRTASLLINDRQKGLYDFSVRLCDFDAGGKETNCADSPILTNVTYRSNHSWE